MTEFERILLSSFLACFCGLSAGGMAGEETG